MRFLSGINTGDTEITAQTGLDSRNVNDFFVFFNTAFAIRPRFANRFVLDKHRCHCLANAVFGGCRHAVTTDPIQLDADLWTAVFINAGL